MTFQAELVEVTKGGQTESTSTASLQPGRVSVTVRVAAGGSATPGQGFQGQGKSDWQDVVLTFGDGKAFKYFYVAIVHDTATEPSESFKLELVSPTGGAMLGNATNATVTILDIPPSSGGGSSSGSGSRGGGGGTFGWLGAMLLGIGWLPASSTDREPLTSQWD